MNPTTARVSHKQRLHEELKQRILTLDLEPGASLDEASLGAEYGMSRTPVREVLRQLAGEGYLRIENNRGAFVAPMTHKTLRDLFTTAPAIYAAIAALAVDHQRPAQLAALVAAQRGFRSAIDAGDAAQMVYFNNRFHLVMGEMADNQYLWPSLQRLLIDHARIGQTFYRPRDAAMRQRMATACAHHELFIAALEERDGERARQLAHDHWALSRDHLEMYVRPDPLAIELADPPPGGRDPGPG